MRVYVDQCDDARLLEIKAIVSLEDNADMF